jgi:hypothetical protein
MYGIFDAEYAISERQQQQYRGETLAIGTLCKHKPILRVSCGGSRVCGYRLLIVEVAAPTRNWFRLLCFCLGMGRQVPARPPEVGVIFFWEEFWSAVRNSTVQAMSGIGAA